MQAIADYPQAQPVYSPNIHIWPQQQDTSILPQMGIQQQQQAIYSQTVQSPTSSRPINALGYQNEPQPEPFQSPENQSSSMFNPKNPVFSGTGMVTKLRRDFGFIDDEIFFHYSACVEGTTGLRVGDRVLVDAAYDTNIPFKWNASRVQLVHSSQERSHNAPSSSSESRSNVRNRYSPLSRKSPDRDMARSSNFHSKPEYDYSERRRERSPLRKASRKRCRYVCSMSRYMVQVPEHLLTIKNADVLEVRRRYTHLYIPSDFFITDILWPNAFPPDAPFSMRSPCHFRVMHKDVEPPSTGGPGAGAEANLDPPDANYLYSAKVMLVSTLPMAEFYEKCLTKGDEERATLHPTQLISFLVGMQGKRETMAIGGPWSPSLDGADPHSDPTVLMRTAVRTCRALTGIDLSGCSQWYRFVELYYRRSETYHKGRLIPPRVETVVIFLADVRSCQPTRSEWERLRRSYKASLVRVINCSRSSNSSGSSGNVAAAAKNESSSAEVSVAGGAVAALESASDASASAPPSSASSSSPLAAASSGAAGVAPPALEEKDSNAPATWSGNGAGSSYTNNNNTEGPWAASVAVSIMDTTDDLLVNETATEMKVVDAIMMEQQELQQQDQREEVVKQDPADEDVPMAEALPVPYKQEIKEKKMEDRAPKAAVAAGVSAGQGSDGTKGDSTTPSVEPQKKEKPVNLSRKKREALKRCYQLPNKPHVVVHPSRVAKLGKFDCAVMSLSRLLDYRPEDTKEHSFEVALFAELFNEMLTRDCGFNIYRELCMLPPVKKELNERKKEAASGEGSSKVETSATTNGEAAEGAKTTKTTTTISTGGFEKGEESKKKARVGDDKEQQRDRKRVRHNENTDDERRSKKKDAGGKAAAPLVVNSDLLLSFVFFDVTNRGYITKKDLEALMYTLGLNLSRSQIRYTVAKAVVRDRLYYRKLTDRALPAPASQTSDEASTEMVASAVDKPADKDAVVLRTVNDSSGSAEGGDTLEAVARGNTDYKQQLKASLERLLNVTSDHGKRTEAANVETEKMLVSLQTENAKLVSSNTRAARKIKDLQSETETLSRQLSDSMRMSRKSADYLAAIQRMYECVRPIVRKPSDK